MRIGIDTGGTFTDVVLVDGPRLRSFKVPSTPREPSAAILGAMELLAREEGAGASSPSVIHGSTVATNALLEGKTARTALVTTEGFEDLIEIGRQARPALYEIEVRSPRPLIDRALRFGVRERIVPPGEVLTALDREAVRAAGEAAARAGAVSIAVGFLHSYARPDHEREAGAILREVFPGPVTLSSSLVREFREFERFSTAAVNAAVAPVVGSYLGRLTAALPPRCLRIMGSSGGAFSPSRAAAEAVTTVLSGPAAGVVAAQRVCASAGMDHAISFDMGGTSTDVSLIPGRIVHTGEAVVAGYPIRTPVIDIHTVGAGGGSVAFIDAGGALKVGPLSAGADPGPACYGKGGPATVTDANLILGRIVPERFLDGRMPLVRETAERAVGSLAGRLGLGLEETAAGVLEVANVTMARAIRQVSLFRGEDPSRFVLCAFGGAGGLHAADLAVAAGTGDVLVPAAPGVLSAWGLLASDLLLARSATVLRSSRDLGAGGLGVLFEALEREALEALRSEAEEGFRGSEPLLERLVDARYLGQSHELRVPAGGDWVEAFHEAHRARYGFHRADEEVIAVTIRVLARREVDPPPPPAPWMDGGSSPSRGRRPVWDRGGWRDALVVERSSLSRGETVEGPAVVSEAGATTYVPSGFGARVTSEGNLLLESRP